VGAERAGKVAVESYDIELDLRSPASKNFRSRTLVRFTSERPATISTALSANSIESITLNGDPLPVSDVWDGARLELDGLASVNMLRVDGIFPYAIEDRGLRRAQDPDGAAYAYSAMYPTSASRVFCYLNDPGSRAKISMNLSTPAEWTCLTNDTTRPFDARMITCAAGPWSPLHRGMVTAVDSPLPVAVHAQRARAGERSLGRNIADLMARSIALYERQLGVPYPYRKAEAVLVHGFPSLGFSGPGLIMFNDNLFDLIATNGPQYAAIVVSHEVAHAWIGDMVDDHWLVEACATYLSRNAVRDLIPDSDGWNMPESVAPDTGYATDAKLIKNLEHTIGPEHLYRGLGTFCRRFANQDATRADLTACWSQIADHDITGWAGSHESQ